MFVEVPNLETITTEFGKEMNKFFDFICCNQIVADFLKKKSTIEYHYFDETEIVETETEAKENNTAANI